MAALINGTAYDFTQIIFSILDTPIAGVKAINYTVEQTKENNFGTGNQPVSRGRGAKNPTGSVEISMNDVEALRDVAQDGDLTNIPPFDIVITYGNPQNVVTHRLIATEFTNDGVEATQGDTDISRTFDLVIGEVKYR